ncbi:hypothetical protein MJ1HA_1518 [Metallosphaera sedula]|nr:hypothetical protein MJ1HA_1518 [Metallosphaera sedula]
MKFGYHCLRNQVAYLGQLGFGFYCLAMTSTPEALFENNSKS